MHRARKLFLISLICGGAVFGLLLIAIMATHLMANRELVKSYIAKKANQATGGTLDYDRLEISFFPLPHLEIRSIRLQKPNAFSLDADELSVYPRVKPMLKGEVSLSSLSLTAPEITIVMEPQSTFAVDRCNSSESSSREDNRKRAIQELFHAFTIIDPHSDFKILSGTITLAFSDGDPFQLTNLNALIERERDDLSLKVDCRSDVSDGLNLRAAADLSAMQAKGQVSLNGVHLSPLLSRTTLPDGITVDATPGAADITFVLDGPERIQGHFDFHFPLLAVTRENRLLPLETVAASGSIDYTPQGLSVSLDNLGSEQPALNLSAAATIAPPTKDKCSAIALYAAIERLDAEEVGAAANTIAGDLPAVQTSVAALKQGSLTEGTFFAEFAWVENRFQLIEMKASGHLADGLVTIPGVLEDLEKLDVDVTYENNHVAFKDASGRFKGLTFQHLNSIIDWKKEPMISIESSSVQVDIAPLYAWLSSFDGFAKVKNYVDSVAGKGKLSLLTITGPLNKPEHWSYRIVAIPENVLLTSSLIPFEMNFSGGEIVYVPGREQATDIRLSFLDGSFTTSYYAKGVLAPESTVMEIDGTLGKKTLDWISTVLPIPNHLQINPPVKLSDVKIVVEIPSVSFTGDMKTAGGVDLYADFTHSPGAWQIRKIKFSDGRSKATVAVTKADSIIDLSFSGNIEKETADRLLRKNDSVLGYLKGDFRALIDTHTPLSSSFTGQMEWEKFEIQGVTAEPISIEQCFIQGNGSTLNIAPSMVSFMDKQITVQGVLAGKPKSMTFDLDVTTASVDEAFITALRAMDKKKSDPGGRQQVKDEILLEGILHLNVNEFSYGGYTWTPVRAEIDIRKDRVTTKIHEANLCGISTVGEVALSDQGISFHIFPKATEALLQETAHCFGIPLGSAETLYDLSGVIDLPSTRETPALLLSGKMELSSDDGRIIHSNVLMKMLAILNVTELFSGGTSDMAEEGVGYSKASVKAEIGGGNLVLEEILLDGNSLKITGKGSIDLIDKEVDIIFLAAPLKTVDRIINKLPIIRYITGGSLVSVPLRVEGTVDDLSVVPVAPRVVGKGLVGLMERTLKAPFKLAKSAGGHASKESDPDQPRQDPDKSQKGP